MCDPNIRHTPTPTTQQNFNGQVDINKLGRQRNLHTQWLITNEFTSYRLWVRGFKHTEWAANTMNADKDGQAFAITTSLHKINDEDKTKVGPARAKSY